MRGNNGIWRKLVAVAAAWLCLATVDALAQGGNEAYGRWLKYKEALGNLTISTDGDPLPVDGTRNEWVARIFAINIDEEVTHVVAAMRSSNGYGALFQCSENGIWAAFLIKPSPWRDYVVNASYRTVDRDTRIEFGEDSAIETDAIYYPGFNVIFLPERKAVGKIFAAAYKSGSLTVAVDREDPVTMTFPPRNADFRKFVENCPKIK